ncbi:MAG: hypothetical protein WDM76_19625 [Limisphaerales bacterium]
MATFYSKTWRTAKYQLAAVLFIFAAGLLFADDDAAKKTFAQRAEDEFHRAQAKTQSDTNDATAAWQFARACYDWADFAKNDKERAAIANQGIAACRPLIARGLKLAAAHYYLAMNLGQLARTESVGALKLVKEMEYEFKLASGMDERFDYAGPARNLGLLYREAPTWPISIGSGRQARDWLEHAAALAPDYPENLLNLTESYLKWRKRAEASDELKKLDELWPKAQTNLTGAAWEQSWADWTARRDAARKALGEPFPSAKSPKNSP